MSRDWKWIVNFQQPVCHITHTAYTECPHFRLIHRIVDFILKNSCFGIVNCVRISERKKITSLWFAIKWDLEMKLNLHFISFRTIFFSPSPPNVHYERMVCTKCFQCEYSHKAVCRRTKSKLRHCKMDAFNSTARNYIYLVLLFVCIFLILDRSECRICWFEFIEK